MLVMANFNTGTNSTLSASLEDYLEAIYNIAGESEIVRSKDIALSLGVAKPSVTGALKTLAKRGLVNYKPYGYVTLTEAGAVEARRVAQKHEVISRFFVDVLGVDKKTSQKAACKVEHALGPAIISRLMDFREFVAANQAKGTDICMKFRSFRSKTHKTVGKKKN